jgi:hypothetical protein
VVFLEGDNLVVFYYLGASEIWPYERFGILLRGLIGGMVFYGGAL